MDRFRKQFILLKYVDISGLDNVFKLIEGSFIFMNEFSQHYKIYQ